MGNKIAATEKKKKLTSAEMRKVSDALAFPLLTRANNPLEEEGPHGPPQAR
jgi:hypothetical protein